jgi:hypothetical protein
MNNTDPTKKTWVNSGARCHLRYGYFVTVNQIVMTSVEFL